ncbi:MAG: CHAT domain-containing protein [Leptolyngbyaceae cyanobacterium]
MPPLFHLPIHNRKCWRFVLIMLLSACLCIGFTPVIQPFAHASVVAQQSASGQQLMQQGRDHYAAGEYTAAATVWQQTAQAYADQNEGASAASALSNQALAHLQLGHYEEAQTAIAAAKDWLKTQPTSNYSRRVLAQVLNTEGQLFMAQGNAVSALTALQQATEQYAALEDVPGQIRAQLNQVQILRVQGRSVELSRSLQDIEVAIESLTDESELELKAVGLRQLGIALQQSGATDAATAKLTESLAVAEQTGNATHISAALLSLGNLSEGEMALAYYERAAAEAPTLLMRSQAQVNALSILLEQASANNLPSQRAVVQQKAADLLMQLEALPPSRSTFFVRINLANQLLQPEWLAANTRLVAAEAIAALLTQTVEQARALGDGQGQTYGLGYLGRLYELNGQIQAAIQMTQEALVVSQSINAGEADYQWQWQLGRLLEAEGETDAAIAAYQQALTTLQRLRSDLVAANRETKFSFRDGIEPVYRDLVSLLLETDAQNTPQTNLLTARNVIESLQVEELVNFFRADCVVTRPQQIDQIDSKAAVIYPIILEDRIEVIVGLPDQSLLRQPFTIPQTDANEILRKLLEEVVNPAANVPALGSGSPSEQTIIRIYRSGTDANAYQAPAQQVYNWLIRPFEAELEASGVDTLAFVLDGKLRNIPMSVLYDGSQHLIEKYAIALTPGLQLVDPQPLAARQVQALAGGVSESRDGFAPLPFVKAELEAIEAQVPSQVLLNEDFDTQGFRGELTSTAFPVVHLATHGKFGATLEDTFILAWDGQIDANQLSTLLQTSEISRDGTIELLVLSACETASGDDRAALGLAGIAVRSGARSTLATLWQVNDRGTSLLMSDVYRLLAETKQTKAQVLRQAQLNLLQSDDSRYHHPYFWAPFVLVGNWL